MNKPTWTHTPQGRGIQYALLAALIIAVTAAFCAAVGLAISPAQAAQPSAAATPTQACTGILAKFRSDAPAAQLTRAPRIGQTFLVQLPSNQPGWAVSCVTGYWVEIKYLDLGLVDASSTATPTLITSTPTGAASATPTPSATPRPAASLTPTATSTPTQVTRDTGLWIVMNGVSLQCDDPCKFEVRSNP